MKNLDLSMMLLLIRIASATCWEMHLKNKAKQNVSLNPYIKKNNSLFSLFPLSNGFLGSFLLFIIIYEDACLHDMF